MLEVSVHENVDIVGMFTLKMVNWDMDKLKVTWSDDELFKEGNEVIIWMGHVDKLEKIFTGEITALEPEFHTDEIPMVTIRGHDRRHHLMRGRKTRTFSQIKDSDIVAQIASDVGLTADCEDSGVILDYVLQHNQSDWHFLQGRAKRIGYELLVEDKTLYFRSRHNNDSEQFTLTLRDDLLEFYPRLSTLNQVGEISVRAWSPKGKEVIAAKSLAGDESGTMGGEVSGASAAIDAFGESSISYIDRPVFSQAEADQYASARLNEMVLGYITGEGVCIGRTDLRAGTVIKIDGIGKRFSGNYYVTSTTHLYAPDIGYRTEFSVRRNAA